MKNVCLFSILTALVSIYNSEARSKQYTGSRLQRVKDTKKSAYGKLVESEFVSTDVSDFDVKRSVRYRRTLPVTKLVSGIQ